MLAVVLLNFAYTQENINLHQKTLDEIAKHNISSAQGAHITVGKGPSAIGVVGNTVYVANFNDSTVSVIDKKNNKKIGDIKVGKGPSSIGVDLLTVFADSGLIKPKIYVASEDNGNVSVIDTENNKKIGDIKVGKGPSAIVAKYEHIFLPPEMEHVLYVATNDAVHDNYTVSRIDLKNNTKTGDRLEGFIRAMVATDRAVYVASDQITGSQLDAIKVRITNVSDIDSDSYRKDIASYASAMGVDPNINTLYIANRYYSNVSVIDAIDLTKKADDIKVGKGPSAIGVDPNTHTVYVANHDDGTVSVIDGIANKVVAKVVFNIQPMNAGHIECNNDKLIAPSIQEFYIWDGSQCTAKPNQGFEFVSWQENLVGNSTQLIKFSPPPSFLRSISDPFLDLLGIKIDDPESKLDITRFGNFTANFKALPPPIPPVCGDIVYRCYNIFYWFMTNSNDHRMEKSKKRGKESADTSSSN